ncbi:5-oxoprolinase subunit B/C family protein [Gemmobacter serpentinus]|uniref:5-oxoprolinase subunit B/C family protein n=1 Tax=Gemmobacter serpentinus TaxID=2652247 RepID=UPI00124DE700|nr:carboxyltransferase domain-containing protein [Gemmobacter serpentinus]
MRFLPVGPHTVLIELPDLAATLALHDALVADPVGGIAEIIPAARTLMIRTAQDVPVDAALAQQIAQRRQTAAVARVEAAAEPVEVPVVYGGEDLADVAQHMGLSVAEVIAAHQAAIWQVAFCGFAPGFAYLSGNDPRFNLPRRATPRSRIPAGAVALAAEFSGIYPKDSPGGWQLIGTTDLLMWDLARDPPALLQPGMRVRFVKAGGEVGPRHMARSTPCPQAPAAGAVAAGSPPSPALTVISTPFPLLFQDEGRIGQAGQGVSVSGAMDLPALRRANRAVGNPANAAALEITLGPVRLRADAPITLALTGAATVRIPGQQIAAGSAFCLDPGDLMTIDPPKAGMRSYLALRGGYAVAPVLGSCATDMLAFVGPAPVASGAVLEAAKRPACAVGMAEHQPALPRPGDLVELPVTLGPRTDWFSPDLVQLFLTQHWLVTPQSSRVGIRLQGDQPLLRGDARELPSEGTEYGAIQVPHSGQPVLFLADHPLTGGYPVIATLHPSALALAGQIPPGARIRFTALAPFAPFTLAELT